MKTKINNSRLFILLLSVCLGMALSTNAQSIDYSKFKFQYDPTSFIGKWEAKSGDDSFELIITKGSLNRAKDQRAHMDLLLGELIYKHNGVVTRHITPDGFKAIFTVASVGLLSPSRVEFRFSDSERKMAGEGEFTINPQNPRKATWKLIGKKPYFEIGSMYDDWNEAGFDIPTELEWTKIE
jgi:hypothetical protein